MRNGEDWFSWLPSCNPKIYRWASSCLRTGLKQSCRLKKCQFLPNCGNKRSNDNANIGKRRRRAVARLLPSFYLSKNLYLKGSSPSLRSSVSCRRVKRGRSAWRKVSRRSSWVISLFQSTLFVCMMSSPFASTLYEHKGAILDQDMGYVFLH